MSGGDGVSARETASRLAGRDARGTTFVAAAAAAGGGGGLPRRGLPSPDLTRGHTPGAEGWDLTEGRDQEEEEADRVEEAEQVEEADLPPEA